MARPKIPDEEKRCKNYQVFLSKEEFDLLENRFKASNWGSRRQWLLELSKGNCCRPDVTDVKLFNSLRDIFMQIKYIGNNFNQLVKKVNSFDNKTPESVVEYELRNCEELMKIIQKQTAVLEELGKKISEKL